MRLLRFVWFVVLIPLSSLAAGAKTQPSGTYRLHPESCYGAIGLDWMARYAQIGPNEHFLVQKNRKDYLAWLYFSGQFQKSYGRMRQRAFSTRKDHAPTRKFDRLYGDVLPVAYAAMCMEDIETISRTAREIRQLRDLTDKDVNQDAAGSAHSTSFRLRLLAWEMRLAKDRISGDMSDVRALRRDMENYAQTHMDKTSGDMFALPETKMDFPRQRQAGYRIIPLDQGRFDLLHADTLLVIANADSDPLELLSAVRLYVKLSQQFSPTTFLPPTNAPHLPVFHIIDTPRMNAGYFLRAIVYEKWLAATDYSLFNDEMWKKYPPRPRGFGPGGDRKKSADYISMGPGGLARNFAWIYRKSRGLLLYEDGPFLWALRQDLRARLNVHLLAYKNQTAKRAPGWKDNRASRWHCEAFEATRLARTVLPKDDLWTKVKSWCQ